MLCNVNAQCDVNIAMYGNGNQNVITEKQKKQNKRKQKTKNKKQKKSAEQDVFRIDKIIRKDHKRKQALVKWKGYGDEFTFQGFNEYMKMQNNITYMYPYATVLKNCLRYSLPKI